MKKLTHENLQAMNVARDYLKTYIAATELKTAITNLRRELSGEFISPEIDKALQAATNVADNIRGNSTPKKAEDFFLTLKTQ